jgi:hypothetical protein
VSEPLMTVPAGEVASRFGFYTDEAMQHPVGVQRHGTTRVVMISFKEYERLKRRDREVIRMQDVDDETLDAILNAEIPAEARALDHPHGRSRNRLTSCPMSICGREADRGADEGSKERPVVVVLATEQHASGLQVVVAPLTTNAPAPGDWAVEVPAHLRLGDARCWIVVSEFNRFARPGSDLRPAPPPAIRRVIAGRHLRDCLRCCSCE